MQKGQVMSKTITLRFAAFFASSSATDSFESISKNETGSSRTMALLDASSETSVRKSTNATARFSPSLRILSIATLCAKASGLRTICRTVSPFCPRVSMINLRLGPRAGSHGGRRHCNVAAACPLAVVHHPDVSVERHKRNRRRQVEGMAEPCRANAADPGLFRRRQGTQAAFLWDGGSLAFPYLGDVTGSHAQKTA